MGILPMQTAFSPLDAAIIVVYLAVSPASAFYFSRRQRNLDEYFPARPVDDLAAGRPVAMAAPRQRIDYLMQPSSTIKYGLILLAARRAWLFLTRGRSRHAAFYRRLKLLHRLQYLEARSTSRPHPGRRIVTSGAGGWHGDLRPVPAISAGDWWADFRSRDGVRARLHRHPVHRAGRGASR